VHRLLRITVALMGLLLWPAVCLGAEPLPRSVLVITQSSPSSGGAIAMFAAFGSDPNINSTSRIAVYTEHLDLNRFSSPQYRELTRSYFRDKYRETPIGVVVVDGTVGLDLVLSWRGEMWSEVPVVFYGVDELSAAQLNLPPNVTGFVAHQTFRGMVDAARLLVPGLKRFALVGDPPARDAYRRNYKQEIAALAAELEFIDLTGLAVTEVKERVAVLPNDAVVFYTAIFVDGAGVVHTPQSALLAISGVASRPIITDVESQLGYGAVGGFVFSLTSAAREAARLAVRVLDGESASQIPVAKIDLNKPIFDGRELKRWNIREDRLPPGSEIRFRVPTAWEQYQWQISSAVAVVLLQAALIASLLFERRARTRAAELAGKARVETGQYRESLAHLVRVHTVGEMSAAIAHEINQPLVAIKNYALAARRRLAGGTAVDAPKVEELLDKIGGQASRAGDVLHSLRAMVKKHESEATKMEVGSLVADTLKLVEMESRNANIRVEVAIAPGLLPVFVDGIQIQQVVLNLMRNAMEAVEEAGIASSVIKVGVVSTPENEIVVSVADHGPGIAPADAEHIFDPFYSTKGSGLGVGLSISRAIVEAHGGRLSLAPNVGGGCVFQFTLPLATGGR
jgi:signal transduction histidine kinase